MAFIREVKRVPQGDGSCNIEFKIDAYDLEACFSVNENDQGWEITSVHVTKGSKDEANEIAAEFMMNEYQEPPIGVN